jgi:hypothetical protein
MGVWRLFNYRRPFFRKKIVHIGGPDCARMTESIACLADHVLPRCPAMPPGGHERNQSAVLHA